MKKPVELPNQLHSWLFSLKKKLKKLKREDRDDILLSYVEQFNEQLNEGLDVGQIQSQLRPISEIIQEIYAEFNLNSVIKIRDQKYQEVVKIKIQGTEESTEKKTATRTLTVFSFLMSFGVWILTITFGAIAVVLPIAVIFAITMSYINFASYYATSLAVIFLGILPFIDIFCFFLTKACYRTSVKMMRPFKQKTPKKFGIKWWLICLTIGGICSALIIGVGVSTTYKNGFIDLSINDKYQNQQELISFTTYQDLVNAIDQDEVSESMVKEYFSTNLENKFDIITNRYYKQKNQSENHQSENLNLKIFRDYNLKKSYQLDVSKVKIQAFLINDGSEIKIWKLDLILPELEWFNYVVSWQPETLEFIYN